MGVWIQQRQSASNSLSSKAARVPLLPIKAKTIFRQPPASDAAKFTLLPDRWLNELPLTQLTAAGKASTLAFLPFLPGVASSSYMEQLHKPCTEVYTYCCIYHSKPERCALILIYILTTTADTDQRAVLSTLASNGVNSTQRTDRLLLQTMPCMHKFYHTVQLMPDWLADKVGFRGTPSQEGVLHYHDYTTLPPPPPSSGTQFKKLVVSP